VTRVTLALSIAALLLLTMATGFLLHWLWTRLRQRDDPDGARQLNDLAARLHAAEAALAAERRENATLTQTLDAERAETGARKSTELAEARAELAAAMEALGDARRDAGEWRRAYEELIREDRETP